MKKFIRIMIPLLLTSLMLLAGCTNQDNAVSGAESNSALSSAVQSEKDSADTSQPPSTETAADSDPDAAPLPEDGAYTSKNDVARYLYLYGHLPDNFITKKEARTLGWEGKAGNLGQVAPGKSIGGDYFGNYEGNLPEKSGRSYHECDIDSTGGYRGSKRIVYSNDGLIYYTEDHYQTFELLYGEE